MKIKSLVEKMGGVQRFTFEPLIPTSRKSMSKFLDITKEEFSDFTKCHCVRCRIVN